MGSQKITRLKNAAKIKRRNKNEGLEERKRKNNGKEFEIITAIAAPARRKNVFSTENRGSVLVSRFIEGAKQKLEVAPNARRRKNEENHLIIPETVHAHNA